MKANTSYVRAFVSFSLALAVAAALVAAMLGIASCAPPESSSTVATETAEKKEQPGKAADAEDWVELPPEAAATVPILHITGKIHKLDMEGGVFVIRDAEGTNYNPTNLPAAFHVDGLGVDIEARRRDDMASIGMVGPLVELLRVRKRPGEETKTSELWGTAWRLEDLAGTGVVDRAQATLEFSEEGKVSGKGSCNGFGGTVTVSGNALRFGPLVTTQMACVEAVMNQEQRYLAALQQAERFEIKESFLYIYATGLSQPLRFIGQ